MNIARTCGKNRISGQFKSGLEAAYEQITKGRRNTISSGSLDPNRSQIIGEPCCI